MFELFLNWKRNGFKCTGPFTLRCKCYNRFFGVNLENLGFAETSKIDNLKKFAKKDIERLSDNHLRLTKEKEELNKERNNFVVDLTAAERENRKQSEVFIQYK